MKTIWIQTILRMAAACLLLCTSLPAAAQSGGPDVPQDPLARKIWLPYVSKAGHGVNHVPNLPSNPFPLIGATGQPLAITFTWTASDSDGDAVAFDLFLEAGDSTPDVQVVDNQAANRYTPAALAYNTHYYWQVIVTDEHGLSYAGEVWDFTTAAAPVNHAPEAPSNPIPADGATGQPLTLPLNWTGVDLDGDTLTYDVYLEAGDTTPDVLIMDDWTTNSCNSGALVNATTYYWQIIAEDEHGLSTAGPVWRFTTQAAPNHAPNTPAGPTPANGAINQGVNVDLSWTGGDPDGDAVTYDVFLEAGDTTPDVRVADDQAGLSFDPGLLEDTADYYWQVIATDEHSLSTSGPVWHFSTVALPNHFPNTPASPFPASGAGGQAVGFLTLSWTGGDVDGDDVTYDVYFNSGALATVLVSDDQAALTYAPGPLLSQQIYSWRVVATDEHGASVEGPAWYFVTSAIDPLYRPAAAAPGGEHTCALTEGGGVRCWGNNTNGQLGDGTYTDRVRPVDVDGLTEGVIAVTSGYAHTCALTGAGAVRCWGSNVNGQLGNGSDLDSNIPVAVTGLGSGVAAIDAKSYHTCALLESGAVRCWGVNDFGQLGDSTTTNRNTPVAVSGLAGAAGVSVGESHSCAITAGGGAVCWGLNNHGQLGDGTTADRHAPVSVSGLSGVTAIDAGGYFTCALTTGGAARCWGANNFGQLGDNEMPDDAHTPSYVSGLGSGVTAITAGFIHACALRDGLVLCWGDNSFSQLGIHSGSMASREEPVQVYHMQGARFINAGAFHTCAGIADGGLQCWGYNSEYQLGDGTVTGREYPVYVIGFILAANDISVGSKHACAKTEIGGVRCWGDNAYGQLGNGENLDQYVPTPLPGLSDVVQVAAGDFHTCALRRTGGVMCWGRNHSGQLGDGTTTDRNAPVAVVGLDEGVLAIAAGNSHTCAMLDSGLVECWGSNSEGQLGDGTTDDRSTPGEVSSLNSVISITAGFFHTCARTSLGTLRCWGDNFYGQLGDDSTTDAHTPTTVSGLPDGTAEVSAAFFHTCARTPLGAARCWGINNLGQLGDGTNTDRDVPVSVSGLAGGVTRLDTGGGHSCAILLAGTVRCWGYNNVGQLGDGLTADRNTPQTALGVPTDGLKISAGSFNTCLFFASGEVRCTGSNTDGQLGQDCYGAATNSSLFITVYGFRIE